MKLYHNILNAAAATSVATLASAESLGQTFYLAAETAKHEGTWLQWPHPYTYGQIYVETLEPMWIEMTRALIPGEMVHIVAYDVDHMDHILFLLEDEGVGTQKVTFLIAETDDVWVRDDGPMFVEDIDNNAAILDWNFNGWGGKAPYWLDNQVPREVAAETGTPLVDLSAVTLEGGAIQVDGRGSLMCTKSSTIENGRNPGFTKAEMERYFQQYLDVHNTIWLDGKNGGRQDRTDFHIDGFAVFGNENTIVTLSREDLRTWGISKADVDRLYSAKDIDGNAYQIIALPLTKNNVVTTYGRNLGVRASYVNYYIANNVVLVPSYNDPSDAKARDILQALYVDRKVVMIDARDAFSEGGMIHCVTQPQPRSTLSNRRTSHTSNSGSASAGFAPLFTAFLLSAGMMMLWLY